MRTTISFDDDVAAQLQRLREQRHGHLRELVNSLLRVGLAHADGPARTAAGPHTKAVSLGRPLLADLDDVTEVLALAEGDDHR